MKPVLKVLGLPLICKASTVLRRKSSASMVSQVEMLTRG